MHSLHLSGCRDPKKEKTVGFFVKNVLLGSIVTRAFWPTAMCSFHLMVSHGTQVAVDGDSWSSLNNSTPDTMGLGSNSTSHVDCFLMIDDKSLFNSSFCSLPWGIAIPVWEWEGT